VAERALSRARAGDEQAFRELIDPYRGKLQLHCYRMLGSVQDAEDLLQETPLAAWRGLERFDGRSSLQVWLYRIATNRRRNALREKGRRPRRVEPLAEPPEPTRRSEPIWLEPYPDALIGAAADTSPGPEARYELKEAVSLAFVGAPAAAAATPGGARAARRTRFPSGGGRRDARDERSCGEGCPAARPGIGCRRAPVARGASRRPGQAAAKRRGIELSLRNVMKEGAPGRCWRRRSVLLVEQLGQARAECGRAAGYPNRRTDLGSRYVVGRADPAPRKESVVLHAGLDLSRKRVDVCLISSEGELIDRLVAPPDRDGLHGLARRVAACGQPTRGVVESMNGARFVHDELVAHGWDVLVADAQRVKGLAPLACKTDKIDSRVLAELSLRDLVPAIWLPDRQLRRERERSRWRLHLVKHRSTLKHRVHSTLIAFGHQRSMSDLFGVSGRKLLQELEIPEPWRSHVDASLQLIDDLDRRIGQIERELKRAGADHKYIPLLMTAPGIGWITGFTIASEIGDISRFSSPAKLTGYTGLCPRVMQSGETDRRGPLSKHGPRYLRWGLMEAAIHAADHPLYRERYHAIKRRVGRQRGAKVAQIDLGRKLSEAIWYMLTRNQPFAPAGATFRLAA
jgi:transposase